MINTKEEQGYDLVSDQAGLQAQRAEAYDHIQDRANHDLEALTCYGMFPYGPYYRQDISLQYGRQRIWGRSNLVEGLEAKFEGTDLNVCQIRFYIDPPGISSNHEDKEPVDIIDPSGLPIRWERGRLPLVKQLLAEYLRLEHSPDVDITETKDFKKIFRQITAFIQFFDDRWPAFFEILEEAVEAEKELSNQERQADDTKPARNFDLSFQQHTEQGWQTIERQDDE